MKGLISAAVTGIAMAACTSPLSSSLDDQQARLNRFVESNRYGSSPDYYLVKLSGIGGPERVALMYAMIDDFTFCKEIADFYMEKYPLDRYTCEKAN